MPAGGTAHARTPKWLEQGQSRSSRTGQHPQDLVGSREVTERWTGSGLDPDRPGCGPTLPTWAVCPQHVPRPLGLGSLRSYAVMGVRSLPQAGSPTQAGATAISSTSVVSPAPGTGRY